MSDKVRLICKTKDGRTLIGTYPYLIALDLREHALEQPDCQSAVLEDVR